MKNLRTDPLWDELKYKLTHPESEEEILAREIKEKTYRESMLKRIFGDKEDGAITGGAAPIITGGVTYDYDPYKAIQEDPALSKAQKVEKIQEVTNSRNEQIESEHNKKMAKIIGGAALEIGSSFIPGLSGAKIANAGLKLSKPLIAQIAKKELTKGAAEGALSGAMSGLGRGMMEDKNPIETAAQDAVVGAAGGAASGKAAGKLHSINPRIKALDSVADKRQDWGIAYRKQSGKPEEAIEKLLEEQRGFVPDAFYKEGIGDVDLVWGMGGKRGFGLSHIIDRRNSQNISGENFIKSIPNVIDKGNVSFAKNQPNISFIKNNDDSVLVKKVWDDKKRNWVVTAFKDYESPSKPINRTPDIANKIDEMAPSSDLQGDKSIISNSSPKLKSWKEWIDELKGNRGH